ncbi:MAG: hypothetical protein OEM81_11440 [Acidimicrobiia bacterium]|nr:hypothetical protein [Acidimicrobiia bacterium]
MTIEPTGPEVRRIERATHIVILLVVLALLLPLLLWPGVAALVWWLQSDTDLNILVYDQTVPDASYLEHASLGLVLEYEKVPFSTEDSFVGAAPGGSPHGAWPSEAPDLLMLVDAYGVYLDDAGQVSDQGTNLITDSLDEGDADRVVGWAASGTVVYGEFNVLGEPTASPAAQRLQGLFGVERAGWAGRPFNDLSAVPDRLVSLAGGTWDHTGPGIVLIAPGQDGPSVVVLTGDELESSLPVVDGVLPGSGRSVEARVDGWFEIISANSKAQVDMWMRLRLTDSGRSLLTRHGIPPEWPFLVRTEESLYLAGDASENSIEFPLRKMTGSPFLMRVLPQSGQMEFFYRVYLPVVQWLVETAGS